MKTARITYVLLGTLVVGLSQIGIANAYDLDQELLAMSGEFEIGNGETKSIVHHKTDSHYRICVHSARHSVPLKVNFDGKQDTIAPGDCADFEAMDIRIAPGGKLDQDVVLIGKYERMAE